MDAPKPSSPLPDTVPQGQPAVADAGSERCAVCGAQLPPATRPGEAPQCLSCLLLTGIERPRPHDTKYATRRLIGERFGNYEVLEEIGRGGMGVIYRARQLEAGPARIVALKTIRAAQADDFDSLERFQREAEAAASLNHPHILPIYEVGEVDGQPFFSMQLAEGGNLATARPKFAGRPREAVALVVKIVRAIAHAHERGLLHRDLKPANILLDAAGEPLVADFGLAKWLDRQSDLTQSLIVFGTPGYLAPEQAAGHANQATPAADIYSLGAILYELLCGRPPFVGVNAWDVLQQAANRPAAPLRKRNPQASRNLETVCARCLETGPAARYPSALSLAEELERWLAGKRIRSRPLAPPTRILRWVRRNPVVTAASGACLLLSAFGAWEHWESSRRGAILQEAATTRRSVAMLPFEDLDAPGEPAARATVLTEAVRQRLAQESAFRVVPVAFAGDSDSGSPQNWRLAGEKAHAPAILSGTVRTRGGGWRVILRLAVAANGRVLAQRVLDLPEGETARVAEAAATLGTEVRRAGERVSENEEFAKASSSQKAREYLRTGKEFLMRNTPEDAHRSVAVFQRAVEADPDCAIAYALLASNYAALDGGEPGQGWLAKARTAAETALRLDPWLAEAHRALGRVLGQEGQTIAAREEILTAYELDPTEARNAQLLGWHWRMLGHPLEALRWFEIAERRTTVPGKQAAYIGDLWVDLAADETAETAYRRASELRPGSTDGPLGLCRLWILQGRFDLAREECRHLVGQHPRNGEVRMMAAATEFFGRDFAAAEPLYRELVESDRRGGEDFPGGPGHLCVLGYLRERAGEKADGEVLLAEARQQAAAGVQRAPEDPHRMYALAAALAALGEADPALTALERAVTAGWIDFRSLALDPRFDAMAGTPRFQEILSRLAAQVAAWRRSRLAAAAAYQE